MADLLDIAPSLAVDVVKLDGKRIVVRGLNGDAIASIVARFPELGALLGGGSEIGMRVLERFGKAIGPIIAAGTGHLGEEQYEQHAATFPVEYQLKLINAIVQLTFPNGITSFMTMMAGMFGGDKKQKVIKVRLKKSPSPSQPSSDAASHQNLQ